MCDSHCEHSNTKCSIRSAAMHAAAECFVPCVCVCVCVCARAHMCICILQCVHIGLQNYGEYEVAVAAKTAVGTGPYSIAQNFTAPEGGESPTLITILLCAAFGSVQHRQALKKRTGMKASHTYICRFRVSV